MAAVEDVEVTEVDSEVTRLFVEDVEGAVEPRTGTHQQKDRPLSAKTMDRNWQSVSSKYV